MTSTRSKISTIFKISAFSIGAITVASVTSASSGAELKETTEPVFNADKAVAIRSEDRAFVNINPAIQFASVSGMFSKTAHGTFGKFPANFETPLHIHSGAYHGIVVVGTMTNPFEGESGAPHLNAGSYWYVPAGMEHTTACISDTPCEFYFYADNAFDFTPVE